MENPRREYQQQYMSVYYDQHKQQCRDNNNRCYRKHAEAIATKKVQKKIEEGKPVKRSTLERYKFDITAIDPELILEWN